ncbi:MAG: sulfotransferase [Bacteroidetes bacterium]|nr:sulfotransferase [Bacteroidota bacterium]
MIAQLNKAYLFAKPSKVVPRLLSYFFYEGRPATTRGQWFNPITFRVLKNASHSNQIPECESPVFITGTGRSGSTILGLVLSMHPDVGFLNEPKALWFVANPKDDLIGSYSNGDALYFMNANDATPAISSNVKSIYSSYLQISSSKRIVDKFPEMIFRIEYLNTIFNNPKYLFLFRNPWSTIASTAIWSNQHTNVAKHEDWWGVNNRKWNLLLEQVVTHDPHLSKYKKEIEKFVSQTDKAAVEWIATMNQGLKMMELFPEKIMPVKYEDLAGDPEKNLKAICDFIQLSPSSEFIDFSKKNIHPTEPHNQIAIHPLLSAPIADLCLKLGYKF